VRDRLPSNGLLWFGVLGGAGAWTVQFLANLGLTFFQCDQPTTRWMLNVHAWEVGLSVAAVAVVLASGAVSLRIFVSTSRIDDVAAHERRGEGAAPPLGRVSFLSMVGLLVNLLALAIVVMTGIGAPLLPVCHQS
jgi:hypothetical protein